MPALVPPAALSRVRQLHDAIDRSSRRVADLHGDRLRCRLGCNDCCVDDLHVSRAEAARIAADHAELLTRGAPAPPGGCAMLGPSGECRVYPSRPYVCRTQGLPLRWIEPEQGVERRDVCPRNVEGGPPIEALPTTSCWTIGAAEEALAAIDALAGARGERIALRALFDRAMLPEPSSGPPEGPSPDAEGIDRRAKKNS